MGLLKKAEKTEYVTKAEFESFKTISSLAVAAIGLAMAASPGMPDASPRKRLEKLAAVAGLDPSESAELRAFLKALDKMGKAEAQREFNEAAAKTRPATFDSIRPPNWRV